ncbi:cysteine dioxygenase [Granulicella sp. WH15]|uniref:cysteine dioxygenase family protein n=1 Tax=Granulicella sp. WH15 TaxID=2602070 RepID=UPI001366C4C8|nr:cysteine dioxygenase [Granulicella sp. WH15]QHN04198.1 cysteine dioxygenase [Granulicella sp. WH15]
MANVHHPRFMAFLDEFQKLIDAALPDREILTQGTPLLAQLIAQDDWLPSEYAIASPTRYSQYLLHADPQDRFSIVSFVWGPGQQTPIHNHTVWGLIGILRGAEHSQGYAQQPDGSLLPEGDPILLTQGMVDAVSEDTGDLHRVSNALADQPSISIHIYGANIGKLPRSTFQLDGTRHQFISGYSN